MNMQAEIESHEKKLEAAATTPEKVETLLSFGKLLVHTDALKTHLLAQQARELIVHSELYKLLKSGEKKAFKNPENAAKKHLAEAYYLLSESERNVRNFEQAIVWGQEALKLFKELRSKAKIADTLNLFGNTYNRWNKIGEATEYYEQSLKIRQELEDIEGCSGSLINLAGISITRGDLLKALDYALEGIELAKRAPKFIAQGYSALGNIYSRLGNYSLALDYYMQSLATHEKNGMLREQGSAYLNIGSVYTLLEEHHHALEALQRAADFFEKVNDRQSLQKTLHNVAATLHLEGKFEEAAAMYEKAYLLASELEDSFGTAVMMLNLGKLSADTGDFKKALSYYLNAEQIARRDGVKAVHAHLILGIGSVYAVLPEEGEAEKTLLKAVDLLKESGEIPYVSQAHQALAEWYEKNGDFKKAFEQVRAQQKIDKEIFTQDTLKKIHDLQTAHEVEKAKQHAEILLLKTEKLELEREYGERRLAQLMLQLQEKQKGFVHIQKYAEILLKTDGETAKTAREIHREAARQMQENNPWTAFEEQFRQIHPDFTQNLLKAAPNLSPSELRVCALIRTNMSTKEIANILSVTEKTIEVHRTNIRKKLHLSAKDNLQTVLHRL